MATITVRALTTTNGLWDPQRGQGLSNFLSDREAVAQIIATRLKLLRGEWFANLADGLPLFQSIIGHSNTTQGVALIIRQRILGTPYVTGIQNMSVTYAPTSRNYSFSCTVQTAFGNIQLNQPISF